METKQNLRFSRMIKLGPAIGDWTQIKFKDPDMEEVNISSIKDVGFDGFSQDKLRYLHYIHYRFAELLVKKFSKDMNIKVELHTVEVNQLSYEAFLSMQNQKVVQADFIIENIGRVNALFEWKLADMMVNRLTGGKGDESEIDQFSDIEVEVLRAQFKEIMPIFSNVWKNLFSPNQINLDFICGEYVPDKKLSLREAYILFAFKFYFGKNDMRKIVIAYPNFVLRKLLNLRSQLNDPIKKRVDLPLKILDKSKLGVRAILGHSSIPMKELQNLQVGDVIPLERSLEDTIDLHIGSKAKLFVQPGIHNNRYSVQIFDFFRAMPSISTEMNEAVAPMETEPEPVVEIEPEDHVLEEEPRVLPEDDSASDTDGDLDSDDDDDDDIWDEDDSELKTEPLEAEYQEEEEDLLDESEDDDSEEFSWDDDDETEEK